MTASFELPATTPVAPVPGRAPSAVDRIAAVTVVELSGRIAPDLAGYALEKITAALHHTGRPVLAGHVRVHRHADPGRSQPVEATAHVDLDGVPLHVSVEASRPREAVDLLADRLYRRLGRVVRERRRGASHGVPHPRDAAAWECRRRGR